MAYEGGQLHRCIGTRATIAKSIPKPKAEFWDLKALEKWRKRQPDSPRHAVGVVGGVVSVADVGWRRPQGPEGG